MTSSVGRASGRLDLLGGVADYSGARVLEVATHLTTTVFADPDDALSVGPVRLIARRRGCAGHAPLPGRARRARRLPALDPLRARRRVGARPPRRDRSTSDEDFGRVRCARLGRRVVERGVGGSDGAGVGRRTRRPAHPRSAVPGSGEPGRRRTVRDHGPGRRDDGHSRRGAPHRVPTGGRGSGRASARQLRGGGRAHRRRARRERRAVPAGARRRVHGQAHRRGRDLALVVLGEPATRRRAWPRSPSRWTA